MYHTNLNLNYSLFLYCGGVNNVQLFWRSNVKKNSPVFSLKPCHCCWTCMTFYIQPVSSNIRIWHYGHFYMAQLKHSFQNHFKTWIFFVISTKFRGWTLSITALEFRQKKNNVFQGFLTMLQCLLIWSNPNPNPYNFGKKN